MGDRDEDAVTRVTEQSERIVAELLDSGLSDLEQLAAAATAAFAVSERMKLPFPQFLEAIRATGEDMQRISRWGDGA